MTVSFSKLLGIALLCLPSVAFAQTRTVVNVATASAISDAPIFIADKKGYFRKEGLDVKITNFDSAARMVAPLGSGQLDVGGGSVSASLYNAVARGIRLRIVADKASSAPGYGANKLLIRSDLVASGRFKTVADLKGLKIAMVAPGVSNTATLDYILQSVGLKYSDVDTVDMPPPNHPIALKNKSVDASVTVEPSASIAVQNGWAKVAMRDDQIDPGHQIAVLLYSEKFAGNRDAATRFMRAYLKAVRFYARSLKDGHFAGETADEVMSIVMEYTPVKDRNILRMITPAGCNIDGRVNEASLERDLAFYTAQGLIKGKVNVKEIVDPSFIEAARK
jgi:NitT/TauT family transport system substrate-binding protein